MAKTNVNPHFEKWAHLKPNQYCTLRINPWGTQEGRNPRGQLHRVGEDGVQDGPACIEIEGYQVWCVNGKVHRLDGPAVTNSYEIQSWWLDGKERTQQEWARDLRVLEFNTRTQEGAEEWLKHF